MSALETTGPVAADTGAPGGAGGATARPTGGPGAGAAVPGPGPIPSGRPAGAVDVEIVIPVHNEERDLRPSVTRLHRYLSERFPLTWTVTVADNASTDGTWAEACALATELPGVRAVRLARKGRGRALRAVWSATEATVAAYMDVDLSTDLDALFPLVAPLLSGHSDVSIGSRLAPGARVVRGPKRELISRTYNVLLRAAFHNRFSDAQCGFKAIRADVARTLLPLVQDDAWFFDTELLVLAEHNGLRIHEVPVDWVDDPDSRVDVRRTAADDLRGVARMVLSLARGRGTIPGANTGAGGGRRAAVDRRWTAGAAQFVGIGVVSTLAFAVLFAWLYGLVGPLAADVVALSACSVANLAANRRFAFPGGRPARPDRYRLAAGVLALLPLVVALPVLGGLVVAGASNLGVDLAVAVGINLTSSFGRFQLLREWSGSGPRSV